MYCPPVAVDPAELPVSVAPTERITELSVTVYRLPVADPEYVFDIGTICETIVAFANAVNAGVPVSVMVRPIT